MSTTKNTVIVVGDTTIATHINPAHIENLQYVAKLSGKPLSRLLNAAIDTYLEVEGAVEVHLAQRKRAKV